jgi:predicted dehydrogenase
MSPTTVALVGASGHGVWHRRTVRELPGAHLVALCDLVPPVDEEDAPLDGVAVFTDHRAMLAAVRPDVVVVCTPPHTHLPIALDVVRAGADLLLEKPPVANLDEHAMLAAEAAAHGRAVQVNFQALGSAAHERLVTAVTGGAIGAVTAIGAAGAWWRPPEYWRRSGWAGKRNLCGQKAVDGALVNPFAHAVMQGLAVAASAGLGPPIGAEVERYRASELEVEDTGCLRVEFAAGPRFTIAVTLAAREFLPGDIVVSGDDGEAALEYTNDRVRLPGGDWLDVPGREGMLANLLAHRADPGVPLLASLSRTRDFTALAAAVVEAPPPVPVPRRFLIAHDGGWAIGGVDAAVRAAASTGALLSETGVPWAATSRHRITFESLTSQREGSATLALPRTDSKEPTCAS